MAHTPKALWRGTPGTAAATVYTVPALMHALVKSVVVANTTATAATISVAMGGVPLAQGVSIAALSVLIIEAGMLDVLAEAETITASQGTVNACTVRVLGTEF